MSPEDFTINVDQQGTAYLECCVPRCYWEQELRGSGVGSDLGSLLSAARDHLAARHADQTVVPKV